MGPIDQAIERLSAQTIERPFDGLVGSREANRIILFILLTLVLISGECIVQGGEHIAAKGLSVVATDAASIVHSTCLHPNRS